MGTQSPSKTSIKKWITEAKRLFGDVIQRSRQVYAYARPRVAGALKLLWERSYAPTSLYVLGLVLIVGTCSPSMSPWERIERDNTLHIITVNGPLTYYLGPEGPTGFQYDLAKIFADRHGLEIEVVLAENSGEALKKLKAGEGQIAAGVIITPRRGEQLTFSVPIVKTSAQLVYRQGGSRPDSLSDLSRDLLEVNPDSSYAELLTQASGDNPDLNWVENQFANDEELLHRVATGEIDYTLADARLVRITQRYHPNLKVAFDVGEPQWVAWAYTQETEPRLKSLADEFLLSFKSTEEYSRIYDRHFGHVDNLGYVDAITLARDVRNKLGLYQKHFKRYAEENRLDWRLLAAVGYQESHWNPYATSPTGVRGLMMLTNATANYLNIPDRLDPVQSIEGGARYLRELIDRLPPEIEEPDRTWMALATYNLGYGHLIDIRKITLQRGGSPNHWPDIRENLPLLMQSRWYSRTKYGYARGREAVKYVGNIRSYYDILRWMTSEEDLPVPEGVDDPEAVRRELDAPEKALEIDSPIL